MSAGASLAEWAYAFVFTQLVEVPLYLRALKAVDEPRGAARRGAIAAGASAITHPVVWFVAPWLSERCAHDPSSPAAYVTMVVVAEAFAVAVEARWLRRFGVRAPWRCSLVANGTSLALGLACRYTLGVP